MATTSFCVCFLKILSSAPTAMLPYVWAGSTSTLLNPLAILSTLARALVLLARLAAASDLCLSYLGFRPTPAVASAHTPSPWASMLTYTLWSLSCSPGGIMTFFSAQDMCSFSLTVTAHCLEES